MPKIVRVADRGSIRPGKMSAVKVRRDWVALAEIDGRVVAFADRCPHSGAALSMGFLAGAIVTCPFHAWRFDVRTGTTVAQRIVIRLPTFPTIVRDGGVYLVLPTRRGARLRVLAAVSRGLQARRSRPRRRSAGLRRR